MTAAVEWERQNGGSGLELDLDRGRLRDMARRAALRLVAVQSPSGILEYEYDARTEACSNRFNMVRMGGATYSLCWAAHAFRDAPEGLVFERAAHEAIGFLLLSCRLQAPDFYVGSYTPNEGFSSEGALGASALLLNGLLFPPFLDRYATEVEALLDLLTRSQTPSGAFRAYPHSRNFVGPQRYYSGEVLLALIRALETTGRSDLAANVARAFPFYREYFRRDPNQSLVLWHADSWSRLVRRPGTDRDACSPTLPSSAESLALTLEFANSVLPKQVLTSTPYPDPEAAGGADQLGGFRYTRPPGISSSVYVEGIARACGACLRAGRTEPLDRLSESLRLGFRFLEQLQITPEQAADLPHPAFCDGGCRNSPESWMLRIDNDQHVITAALAAVEVMDEFA